MEKYIPKSKIYCIYDEEFLGDLTEYIDVRPSKFNPSVITELATISDKGVIEKIKVIIKLYDSFEIIFNKVTREFHCFENQISTVELGGEKYIIQLYYEEKPFSLVYPLFDYYENNISPSMIYYIRKLLALQWLLCLDEMSINKIHLTKHKSKNEESLYDHITPHIYDVGKYKLNESGYEAPEFKKLLKVWFYDSIILLDRFVKGLFFMNSIDYIGRIEEIVREVDESHLQWVEAVKARKNYLFD